MLVVEAWLRFMYCGHISGQAVMRSRAWEVGTGWALGMGSPWVNYQRWGQTYPCGKGPEENITITGHSLQDWTLPHFGWKHFWSVETKKLSFSHLMLSILVDGLTFGTIAVFDGCIKKAFILSPCKYCSLFYFNLNKYIFVHRRAVLLHVCFAKA